MRCAVTGGVGFIGSALVLRLVAEGHDVLNLDALTYAGNAASIADVEGLPNYRFERVDLRDAAAMAQSIRTFHPQVIFHLAAESHVDRSIDGPGDFVHTNVLGTFHLLEAARRYSDTLSDAERDAFRFVHVSTDEVFGSLGDTGRFRADSPYAPHSPYAATKAASDHLARAWRDTYRLPVIVTNCSNNYGPRQFPEKLIPLMILSARAGRPLPVYGTGSNVRDWLFVEDHVDGLVRAAVSGTPGSTYLFGGAAERNNLDVVRTLCRIMDEELPSADGPYERLIEFVADRPGHDFRYAIDASASEAALGWAPRHTFEDGLRATVRWYVRNEQWCTDVLTGKYRGERLGLGVE
jgi:dTDP-glucose 4,6-dehydratase